MKFFISSTFIDLKQTREKAIHILNNLLKDNNSSTGDIIAMEFFSASEHTPKDVCLDNLSKSDIMIGIYGNRYGSIDPDEKLSLTELEFDYAKKNNIPILAFVYQSGVREEKQEEFIKEKINKLNNTYASFITDEEFGYKLNSSLKEYFKDFDGYSINSLWSIITEAKNAINNELPKEFRMEPYIPGQQNDALNAIMHSTKNLKAYIPNLIEENKAIYEFAYLHTHYPERISDAEVTTLLSNIKNTAPTILSNWTLIHIGIPNHATHLLLTTSYLSLCRIETRLLTEPWTEELRQEALKIRDTYKKQIEISRYED